jgi:two-component system chemotaxis response regulator CheY
MNNSLGEWRDKTLTALVIDDDAFSRKLTCGMLSKLGVADILEAACGKEGLRISASALPDIIILDWIMPGMTGAETLDALKSDSSLQDIPVVVTSESTCRDAIVQTARAGASAAVIKPFATTTLSARILRAISEDRAQSPSTESDGTRDGLHRRRA